MTDDFDRLPEAVMRAVNQALDSAFRAGRSLGTDPNDTAAIDRRNVNLVAARNELQQITADAIAEARKETT